MRKTQTTAQRNERGSNTMVTGRVALPNAPEGVDVRVSAASTGVGWSLLLSVATSATLPALDRSRVARAPVSPSRVRMAR